MAKKLGSKMGSRMGSKDGFQEKEMTMSKEHSSAFDGRMAEYVADNGFTPALFQAMSERHKYHIDRIEKKQGELSSDVKDSFSKLADKIDGLTKSLSNLPCDKHDGDRKVLEVRLKAVEEKDMRITMFQMFACSIVGGLIVSGVINIGTIAKHMVGM